MIRKVNEQVTGLVTVADAAKFLGVSHVRVNQFIQSQRLKAVQLTSRMYLVDAADLHRFAKVRRTTGRPKQK